jgi:hypothetical protein
MLSRITQINLNGQHFSDASHLRKQSTSTIGEASRRCAPEILRGMAPQNDTKGSIAHRRFLASNQTCHAEPDQDHLPDAQALSWRPSLPIIEQHRRRRSIYSQTITPGALRRRFFGLRMRSAAQNDTLECALYRSPLSPISHVMLSRIRITCLTVNITPTPIAFINGAHPT